MKYSTKLSDTVHVMVLIAINQEKSLSSASIAESVHTNPGFVRQLMLKLKKDGTYDQCSRTCPSFSFKTSRTDYIAGYL
jgi:transcriptional regulator, BadM/Rrf2 family